MSARRRSRRRPESPALFRESPRAPAWQTVPPVTRVGAPRGRQEATSPPTARARARNEASRRRPVHLAASLPRVGSGTRERRVRPVAARRPGARSTKERPRWGSSPPALAHPRTVTASPVPPSDRAWAPWAGGSVRRERSRRARAAPGRVPPRWPGPMAAPMAAVEPAGDPRPPGRGAQGRARRTRPGTRVDRGALRSLRSMWFPLIRPRALPGSPRASSPGAAPVAAAPASRVAAALLRAVTPSAPAEPPAVTGQPGAREVRRMLPAMPPCRRARSATRSAARGRAAKAETEPKNSRREPPRWSSSGRAARRSGPSARRMTIGRRWIRRSRGRQWKATGRGPHRRTPGDPTELGPSDPRTMAPRLATTGPVAVRGPRSPSPARDDSAAGEIARHRTPGMAGDR
jgi:hypothetical protein